MSHKVENAVGGLVQSIFGGLGGHSSFFGTSGPIATKSPSLPTLAYLSFIEQFREAWKHSKEV